MSTARMSSRSFRGKPTLKIVNPKDPASIRAALKTYINSADGWIAYIAELALDSEMDFEEFNKRIYDHCEHVYRQLHSPFEAGHPSNKVLKENDRAIRELAIRNIGNALLACRSAWSAQDLTAWNDAKKNLSEAFRTAKDCLNSEVEYSATTPELKTRIDEITVAVSTSSTSIGRRQLYNQSTRLQEIAPRVSLLSTAKNIEEVERIDLGSVYHSLTAIDQSLKFTSVDAGVGNSKEQIDARRRSLAYIPRAIDQHLTALELGADDLSFVSRTGHTLSASFALAVTLMKPEPIAADTREALDAIEAELNEVDVAFAASISTLPDRLTLDTIVANGGSIATVKSALKRQSEVVHAAGVRPSIATATAAAGTGVSLAHAKPLEIDFFPRIAESVIVSGSPSPTISPSAAPSPLTPGRRLTRNKSMVGFNEEAAARTRAGRRRLPISAGVSRLNPILDATRRKKVAALPVFSNPAYKPVSRSNTPPPSPRTPALVVNPLITGSPSSRTSHGSRASKEIGGDALAHTGHRRTGSAGSGPSRRPSHGSLGSKEPKTVEQKPVRRASTTVPNPLRDLPVATQRQGITPAQIRAVRDADRRRKAHQSLRAQVFIRLFRLCYMMAPVIVIVAVGVLVSWLAGAFNTNSDAVNTLGINGTASVSPSVFPSVSSSVSPSVSASIANSPAASSSVILNSVSDSATPSALPSSQGMSSTSSVRASVSSSATITATVSATGSTSFTSSQSMSPSRSASVSISASTTSSQSVTPTSSKSTGASSSETPTASVSITPSESGSYSVTVTMSGTNSQTITSSFTVTPSQSLTNSMSFSASISPTGSVSLTATETPTQSSSFSPSMSSTVTITPTVTPSLTETVTPTPSSSFSPTASGPVTITPTVTPSLTTSPSPTVSPSQTPSYTMTRTNSMSPSISLSSSMTVTKTPSPSASGAPLCISNITFAGNVGDSINLYLNSFNTSANNIPVAEVYLQLGGGVAATLPGRIHWGGNYRTGDTPVTSEVNFYFNIVNNAGTGYLPVTCYDALNNVICSSTVEIITTPLSSRLLREESAWSKAKNYAFSLFGWNETRPVVVAISKEQEITNLNREIDQLNLQLAIKEKQILRIKLSLRGQALDQIEDIKAQIHARANRVRELALSLHPEAESDMNLAR